MVRMEVDYNLKMLGQLFQVVLFTVLEKSVKTNYRFILSRIHLIYSFRCDRSILYMKKGNCITYLTKMSKIPEA